MRQSSEQREEKRKKKMFHRILVTGITVALVAGGLKAAALLSSGKWRLERPVNPETIPEPQEAKAGEAPTSQGKTGKAPALKPESKAREASVPEAEIQGVPKPQAKAGEDSSWQKKTEGAPAPEPESKAPEASRFSEYSWYERDREGRYQAYQALHPKMSADQVVFRVDAELDRPFYTGIQTIADVKTEPLVPNKYHRLPDDFVPANLVFLPSGRQVTKDTKAAYGQLQQAAAQAGIQIGEVSAYRSISYQKQVYARYLKEDSQARVDTYSSRPGHSDHHTGEAIDLVGPKGGLNDFTGTPEAAWVAENAWKYGFIIRFPKGQEDVTGYMYEPWHIRYVGKDIAAFMKENGIATLEEYQVKYMDHKPDPR